MGAKEEDLGCGRGISFMTDYQLFFKRLGMAGSVTNDTGKAFVDKLPGLLHEILVIDRFQWHLRLFLLRPVFAKL